MKIQFIGQGDTAKSAEHSVANLLIRFFKYKDFHTFTCMSAFVSRNAIKGIEQHISDATHLENITIVTGIDQNGTSKEALEALLNLNINAYVFYFPSPTPIFHPKIYLFEGGTKSELIIGSSNLTFGGLVRNVEASLLVSLENIYKDDRQIIIQIKDYFSSIFDRTDPNLRKLTKELIEDLVKMGVVPTEAELKSAYYKEIAKEKDSEKSILSIFPKRSIPNIPKELLLKTELGSREEDRNLIRVNGDIADKKKESLSKLIAAAPEIGHHDLKTGDIIVSKTAHVPRIVAIVGKDKIGHFVGLVSDKYMVKGVEKRGQQFKERDPKFKFRRLYPGNGKLPHKYDIPENENLQEIARNLLVLGHKWLAEGMPASMGQKKK